MVGSQLITCGEKMRKAFFVICFIVSGCDSSKLSDIEEASKNASECAVHQINPNDCVKFHKALEIAELKATQAGIGQERIYASRQIGEKVIKGDQSESPYKRVKRSLERKPFYIKPIDDNFSPYKLGCPKFDIDESKPDLDEAIKALEWYGRDKNRYQTVAYLQKGETLTVLFAKIATPCRPGKYSDINDEFPILTNDQLNNFKNSVYLKETKYPGYIKVTTLVFEKYDEAEEKFHELSGESKK